MLYWQLHFDPLPNFVSERLTSRIHRLAAKPLQDGGIVEFRGAFEVEILAID